MKNNRDHSKTSNSSDSFVLPTGAAMSRLACKTAGMTGLVFMIILFRGCMFGAPNHRDFYKGNVELHGKMNSANRSGKLEYIV